MTRRFAALTSAIIVIACATLVEAQERNPIAPAVDPALAAESRILVRMKPATADGRTRALASEDRAAALAVRAGGVRATRRLGGRLHVLELTDGAAIEAQLEKLRADPDVEYAEPDRRRYAHAVPNDPFYSQQWYLQADAATPSATRSEQAWDTTTGSQGVVVAVLDTGVRFEHPDLRRAEDGGRLLPGYDFVSNVTVANDGDGRDADASDPGDYIMQTDLADPSFDGCRVVNSSWHGTRVAGIIGARSNDSNGVVGGTWAGWILPVRVLGKCGGADSDILLAMLWAAGVHVDGVPDNPYPAKIVNMSLGSSGPCTRTYEDVIAELAERGTLVVVSAGNDGGPVESPANCDGVVAVAGLRHAGTKVGYSSLGPAVALSAPAGNCVNTAPGSPCLYSIITTINHGTAGPGADGHTDTLSRPNYGTSFSAPIVSSIAALMLAVNGNLGAAELRDRLREGATPSFPVSTDGDVPQCRVPIDELDLQEFECNCTFETCGAGIAHAPGALLAAQRPIAAVAVPASFAPGDNVSLSGAGSAAACGRTIVAYRWEVIDAIGVGVLNPDFAEASVFAPAVEPFTVRLTVTDDQGGIDTADVRVSPSGATTPARAAAGTSACRSAILLPSPSAPAAPPAAASGGGGGGAAGVPELVGLLILGLAASRRRRLA